MDNDEAIFFREFTLAITSSLKVEQALETAFNCLANWMPVDGIDLNYINEQERTIVPVAAVSSENYTKRFGKISFAATLSKGLASHIEEQQRGLDPLQIYNQPNHIPEVVAKHFPHALHCSTIVLGLKSQDEFLGVFIVTAEGSDRYTPEHVELLRSVKEPIGIAMSNARRYMELERLHNRLADDNRALSADLSRMSHTEVIGADFGLREVMGMVQRVASSRSSTLLLGETGTGKEVIANAIHRASPRNTGPFIQMQCGAIPETLLDSELFGHERGAFTGASALKRGRFERADGGTLFLDEVGELSHDAQVKLLRVLQEQTFERVGGTESIKVDVRVIAATHRDLEQMVAEGKFREDLWYRLNVLPIRIPPLRLRRIDIPRLAQHFIVRKSREMNLESFPKLEPDALDRLQQYDWPGNVRELNNIIERALILSSGNKLVIPPLGSANASTPSPPINKPASNQTLDEAVAEHIRNTLERTKGQIAGPGGAAELLDMNPSTLRFRIKKLGIKYD